MPLTKPYFPLETSLKYDNRMGNMKDEKNYNRSYKFRPTLVALESARGEIPWHQAHIPLFLSFQKFCVGCGKLYKIIVFSALIRVMGMSLFAEEFNQLFFTQFL